MAERLAYLEAVIGADITQFRRGMRDIRNEMGFLSETVSGLTGLGRNLTYTLTTPLVAMGTAAISTAMDFQASMYNINAIAGLTQTELDALSERALNFGSATRSGAQAAADALYTVFSAGLTDADQAFSAMEVATYTAEAGLADLTTTTEALLSVMLSYGDTTEEMAWKTSNAMTQMVAVGVGSMQEFANALGNVVPTATALDMDINQLMGDMAFLTQRGLSAAKSGTALNSALTALIKPSEAMSVALHELGAGSSQELIEKFGGVNEALMALIKNAGGSQEKLAAMFGNIRGLRAINLFASDIDGWSASMDTFNESLEGATMRAWEQQMMSFSASWDMLQSAIQGAAIVIGQEMFPVLQPIVDAMRELILGVTQANPELLSMGVIFGAVAAAVPPLIWVLFSLISPFGLLVGAVTAFGVAVAENFGGIADTITSVTGDVQAALSPLQDTLTDFWDTIFPEDAIANTDPFAGIKTEFPAIQDFVTVNPSGGAISLWDYYESEGFIDKVSWNDFMDLALEGGWTGGAITPDSPLKIAWHIEGVTTKIPTAMMEDAFPELRDAALYQADEIPETFAERFQQAMATVFPRIGEAAKNIFVGAISWFDAVGGYALRSITRSINSIDENAIYTAFTQLVSGDWTGLLDTLGLSGDDIKTSIEGWKTKIQEALPEVTAGLQSLFENAAFWIIDEGIPLFAQSMGFLAGKIGVMLYDAMQAGIAFFTSGGAGDAASSISDYMSESIATPFQQGIADATAGSTLASDVWATLGTDISTGMATSIEGIDLSGVFAALQIKVGELGVWFKDTGLAQIMEGIGYWSGKISIAIGQAITSAFSFITGTGDAEGSAISLGEDIAQPFSEGFNNALGESNLSGLETVIPKIVEALLIYVTVDQFLPLGTAIKGVLPLVFGRISFNETGLHFSGGLIRAIATRIGQTSAWTAVTTAIGTGFAKAMAGVGIATSWIGGIATSITTAIGSAIAAIGLGTLALAVATVTLAIGAIVLLISEDAREFARQTLATALGFEDYGEMSANWEAGIENVIKGAIDTVRGKPEVTSPVIPMQPVLTYDEFTPMDDYITNQFLLSGKTGNTFPINMQEYTVVPEGTPEVKPVIIDGSQVVIEMVNGLPVVKPPVGGFIINETVTASAPNLSLDLSQSDVTGQGQIGGSIPSVDLTSMATEWSAQLSSGMDTQTIIDSQLLPLENAWVAMFAPEGLMATNFTTFSTGVITGFTNLDTTATTFFTNLVANVPNASDALLSFSNVAADAINPVTSALNAAQGAAAGLISTIKGLLSLEGTLDVTVNVSGSSNTDGSAKKGLPSVPFDGFIAELHKGERVLTAAEAKAYNEGGDIRASSYAMQGGLPSGGDSNTVNNVSVNGNLTVDQILFEFKRRGIKLDGKKT